MSFDDFMILNHEHLPFLHDIYHDDAWWLHYCIYKEESSFRYSSTRTHRKGWYLNYWIRCFSLHLCLVTIATRAICGFCNLCAMVRSFRLGRWWWRWLWWLLRSKKQCRKGWCWGSRHMVDMVVSTKCIVIDICIYIYIFLFCERLQRYS